MIEASPASQLGDTPFGLDPSLMFQPVQRRIERTLIDLQDVFRNLLDAFGDRPAMQRTGLQGPEDQEIESALQ